MTKPIRPSQVVEKKREQLPDAVIEVFNELIAEKWNGYSAKVLQTEVESRLVDRLNLDKSMIHSRHLLDVEDIFRKAGWSVKYEKASYGENWFAPYFEFSKKEKR